MGIYWGILSRCDPTFCSIFSCSRFDACHFSHKGDKKETMYVWVCNHLLWKLICIDRRGKRWINETAVASNGVFELNKSWFAFISLPNCRETSQMICIDCDFFLFWVKKAHYTVEPIDLFILFCHSFAYCLFPSILWAHSLFPLICSIQK